VPGGSAATGEEFGVPKKGGKEKMKKIAFRFGLALMAIALALPVMAKTDSAKTESKPKNATLTLDAPVKFGSAMVNAGTYKLVIENDKATLESNNNKVVASVPGHWQEGKQKADSTGFETTNGQVDQIFLHGNSGAFVVSGNEVSKN
jgi:hypothetical protein